MKTASISDIKKELGNLEPEKVRALCLRLAAYKKDNKELLNYLLFEANDEESYVNSIKEEMTNALKEMNKSNLYFAKKTIRKVLRMMNRYIKFSGNKQTTVELLIFFCQEIRATKLPIHKNKVLANLYQRQLEAIQKALSSLHEDLQFDYQQKIEALKE